MTCSCVERAEFGEDLALERLLAHIPEDERAREMAAGAALDVHEAFVQASDPSASA